VGEGLIQSDQKVSVHLIITVQKHTKNKAITEYIRNMDRAILNTVFENSSACQYMSGDWRGTL
jgi:hypothetical protein